MILNNSIKVKNYKCFADEQGFDKIYPINVIIGKNNSGKSSLLDLISYVLKPDAAFISTGRNRVYAEVFLTDKMTEKYIESVFSRTTSGGDVRGFSSYYEYGETFLDSTITYKLEANLEKIITNFEKPLLYNTQGFKGALQKRIETVFNGKKFKRILAERDITVETVKTDSLTINSNGQNTTNVIRKIINEVVRSGKQFNNPDLIQKTLMDELTSITKPEIEFTGIVPRDHGGGEWEIYFRDSNSELIGLTKMGSGIKTILLVLLNLIVIPEIENISKENIVFGFEELENNLHPSLQRRLFKYIANYANQFKSYFFITTHSSIVLDYFGSNKNTQIIHVQNDGISSKVTAIETNFDGKNVLKDLDYRPSDLLMSNGIIWIEGPSDALYLELFIDLYEKKTGEELLRLNYTIQALSTAIWKYAGFKDFNWENLNLTKRNQIITLEKLNHNHLIIIDNDNNYDDKLPSVYDSFDDGTGKNKASLIFESMKISNHSENDLENNFGDSKDGKLFFWVNEGTFETVLKYFVSNKGKYFEKYFDQEEKRGYFEKKREGENYSYSKVELAADIAKFALDNNLSLEDFAPENSYLLNKLERLVNTIKSWN